MRLKTFKNRYVDEEEEDIRLEDFLYINDKLEIYIDKGRRFKQYIRIIFEQDEIILFNKINETYEKFKCKVSEPFGYKKYIRMYSSENKSIMIFSQECDRSQLKSGIY